jgi:hypothetical protein
MKNNVRSLLLLGSVATLSSLSALAQENPVTTFPRDFEDLGGAPVSRAGVNFGYVGATSAKFQGARSGNSDAFNVNADAGTHVVLTDDWFLNLGLVSDNDFLGGVAGDPVPDAIHTLRLNLGIGYRLNDQWTFTGLVSPSLYRFEDVNGDDIGASGGVVAAFVQNPSLIWSFGMIGSPDSDVPVLPIVGVRWLINDHYTLEVGMPKTRLTRNIEPNLAIYTGLDLNGTVFRTDEHLMPPTLSPRNNTGQYNSALASYHDIRLGVGASYEFWRAVRAEVETGFSVYREIYYKDIDQSVEFKPAPYVRLGLGVRF